MPSLLNVEMLVLEETWQREDAVKTLYTLDRNGRHGAAVQS